MDFKMAREASRDKSNLRAAAAQIDRLQSKVGELVEGETWAQAEAGKWRLRCFAALQFVPEDVTVGELQTAEAEMRAERDALTRQLQEQAEKIERLERASMEEFQPENQRLRDQVFTLTRQLQEAVEKRDRLRGLLRERRAKITELRERLEKYEPPMWPSRSKP